MRLRHAAAALALVSTALALAPTASAHPVHIYCGPLGVNPYPGAYIAQLDPNDPSTWTSSVADVTFDVPGGHCKGCQEDSTYDAIRTSIAKLFNPPYDDLVYHDLGYCSFFPNL